MLDGLMLGTVLTEKKTPVGNLVETETETEIEIDRVIETEIGIESATETVNVSTFASGTAMLQDRLTRRKPVSGNEIATAIGTGTGTESRAASETRNEGRIHPTAHPKTVALKHIDSSGAIHSDKVALSQTS